VTPLDPAHPQRSLRRAYSEALSGLAPGAFVAVERERYFYACGFLDRYDVLCLLPDACTLWLDGTKRRLLAPLAAEFEGMIRDEEITTASEFLRMPEDSWLIWGKRAVSPARRRLRRAVMRHVNRAALRGENLLGEPQCPGR
jgi:hypothetical protein